MSAIETRAATMVVGQDDPVQVPKRLAKTKHAVFDTLEDITFGSVRVRRFHFQLLC